MKKQRTLEEILQSTSDVLFPAGLGEVRVEIDSRDADGDTPLHVMAWRDDAYGVKTLVEAGAKIDAIGDMGQTPLHVAVMKQSEEIVAMLLNAGANPDIRSEFGDTPRELAAGDGASMKKIFTRRASAQQTAARERGKKRGA